MSADLPKDRGQQFDGADGVADVRPVIDPGMEAYVSTLHSIGLRESYLMNKSGSMEVRGLHPFSPISMGMLQHTAPSPSLYRAGTR